MRGRKPKPTHLKLLEGNPGQRRINRHEPRPEGDLTDPPEWMTEEQQEGWRYAIAHAPLGLLKRLDRAVGIAPPMPASDFVTGTAIPVDGGFSIQG